MKMIDAKLSDMVNKKINDLIKILNEKIPNFDTNLIPEPEYDLKGVKAGEIRYYIDENGRCYDYSLHFNPILLKENVNVFINRTVPHEIAHIVDRALLGYKKYMRNHGKNWKSIMSIFGVDEILAYHSYDTSSVESTIKRRAKKRFVYTCNCMTTHLLSRHQHKHSEQYICRTCSSRLTFTGKEKTIY